MQKTEEFKKTAKEFFSRNAENIGVLAGCSVGIVAPLALAATTNVFSVWSALPASMATLASGLTFIKTKKGGFSTAFGVIFGAFLFSGLLIEHEKVYRLSPLEADQAMKALLEKNQPVGTPLQIQMSSGRSASFVIEGLQKKQESASEAFFVVKAVYDSKDFHTGAKIKRTDKMLVPVRGKASDQNVLIAQPPFGLK